MRNCKHRVTSLLEEFDINFLNFCSNLNLQFLNGVKAFHDKVFHERSKKEIRRYKSCRMCWLLNMSMACEKVFIKALMTQNEKELIKIIKNLQDKY